MVFDLPILWFLLPPPGDHRIMRSTTRPIDELYTWLLGQPHQLEPLYERLRKIGITEPTTAEETVEKITGVTADAKQWSYRERRKDLLLALLNKHADSFDTAVEELGRVVDHLRQVGMRGFIAEQTRDEDFTYREGNPPREVPQDPLARRENEAARADTSDERATPGGRP